MHEIRVALSSTFVNVLVSAVRKVVAEVVPSGVVFKVARVNIHRSSTGVHLARKHPAKRHYARIAGRAYPNASLNFIAVSVMGVVVQKAQLHSRRRVEHNHHFFKIFRRGFNHIRFVFVKLQIVVVLFARAGDKLGTVPIHIALAVPEHRAGQIKALAAYSRNYHNSRVVVIAPGIESGFVVA